MRATTMLKSHRRPGWALLTVAAACAFLAVPAAPALAQSGDGDGAPVRVKRPVRRPVIDLERQARKPRPGQIVPGEPAPTEAPAPATTQVPEPSAPAAPAPGAQEPAEEPATMSMMSIPAPAPAVLGLASGEPVSVVVREVGGPASQAEWRLAARGEDEGPWQALTAEAARRGVLEIRTGMAGSAVLEIDGRTTLRVGRLSRLRVQRMGGGAPGAGGAPATPGELLIQLDRGKVEVEPRAVDQLGLAVVPVRIVTPAATLMRRVPVEVTHDAFYGTRETMLTRE